MSRIAKTADNIVSIPKSVSVTAKGYVYWNATTTWVDKANGTGKRADHKKECIGVVLCPGGDWKKDRRMYANSAYYRLFPADKSSSEKTPAGNASSACREYPQRFDCISAGLYAAVSKIAEESGLYEALLEVFGAEDACLIMDLAMYMISRETAEMRHFPHWAASHAIFSESIPDAGFISAFEKEISPSLISRFRNTWAAAALGDGRVLACYDSVNTCSQAPGVFLVQQGYAVDDPEECRLNAEYAMRQKDGLPVTFNVSPGAVKDISEAANISAGLSELKKPNPGQQGCGKIPGNDNISITVFADRGHISHEHIQDLRNRGIGFIFLLNGNTELANEVLGNHIDEVKKAASFIRENGRFALTVRNKIFPDDEKESRFHIVWDGELETRHRFILENDLIGKADNLKKHMAKGTRLTDENLNRYRQYFNISCHEDGALKANQSREGSENADNAPEFAPAYVIDSFERNAAAVGKAHRYCGYLVYVSDQEMTAQEIIKVLDRRDGAETMLRALKGWLGRDKIGFCSENTMQAKNLICFAASVIGAQLLAKTEAFREQEMKRCGISAAGDLPAVADLLEEIRADRDLCAGTYVRRYLPGKLQKTVLDLIGVTLEDIDAVIANLADEP
ncbi:transposase [Succinimonas sp.]|uniref:transposase n=1 Tax=Succinimonas sp. TaxID=1936151 RepID=UPI003866C7E3